MEVTRSLKRFGLLSSPEQGLSERSPQDEVVDIRFHDLENKIDALKKWFSGIDLEKARIDLIKEQYDNKLSSIQEEMSSRIRCIEETLCKIEHMNERYREWEEVLRAFLGEVITLINEKNARIEKLESERSQRTLSRDDDSISSDLKKIFPSGSSSAILSELLAEYKK
ncbi:MAG TPA: hypothetical protein PKY78_03060 [Candidatus Omnitrophota bacterium]|nr:hypothetical protein [Candidatus Omnitrophota bacterium]HPS19953.1 hypothetical protein [Candidatus Omnitrophota bacterium]